MNSSEQCWQVARVVKGYGLSLYGRGPAWVRIPHLPVFADNYLAEIYISR